MHLFMHLKRPSDDLAAILEPPESKRQRTSSDSEHEAMSEALAALVKEHAHNEDLDVNELGLCHQRFSSNDEGSERRSASITPRTQHAESPPPLRRDPSPSPLGQSTAPMPSPLGQATVPWPSPLGQLCTAQQPCLQQLPPPAVSVTPLPTFSAPPPPPPLPSKRATGDWSDSEDEIIIDAVSRMGCKWRRVAALLYGRSDDAVRNRWARLHREGRSVALPADGVVRAKTASRPYSKPAKTEGAAQRQCWSREEDQLIIATVAEVGSRWGLIASLMPHRTAHGVRNRYNRLKLMQAQQPRHGGADDGETPLGGAGGGASLCSSASSSWRSES